MSNVLKVAAVVSLALVSCARAGVDLSKTPDGGVFEFPSGTNFLNRPIRLQGRRGLTVRGKADTVLCLHFSPWGERKENNGAFVLDGCEDIRFENLRITTDNPVNASGRVVALHPEDTTYDVEIDPQFPITGWEHFLGTDTFDEEGMPDYAIETYDDRNNRREMKPDGHGGQRLRIVGTEYEVLSGQRIRVKAKDARAVNRLHVGHRVLFRYIIYGSCVFTVHASANTVFRDVEIERCASFGALVTGGSRDVTFERFNMRSPSGDHALYCANADGIHVAGLSGRLVLKDCHFKGLGDDALNVHSTAGRIKSYDPATGAIVCIGLTHEGAERKLPREWARSGDELVVYDARTFLTKGKIRLTRYADGDGCVSVGATPVGVGDVLANDRTFPSVTIEDCSVENTRARGFLLQSRNMTVRNCRFRGLALPGLLMAPDIRHWQEVGPVENVTVTGCLFEKCAMNGSAANLGAITVKTSHDSDFGDCPAGVHRNLRIVGNTFRGCGSAGIFVASTRGFVERDNVFVDCWRNPPKSLGLSRTNVLLHNTETEEGK